MLLKWYVATCIRILIYWYVVVWICWCIDVPVYWYIDLRWHRGPVPMLHRHMYRQLAVSLDSYNGMVRLLYRCIDMSTCLYVDILVCWYVDVMWDTSLMLRRNIDLDMEVRWHVAPMVMVHGHIYLMRCWCTDKLIYYCDEFCWIHVSLYRYIDMTRCWYIDICM